MTQHDEFEHLQNELTSATQAILNAKAMAIKQEIDGFYIETLDIAEASVRLAVRYGKREKEVGNLMQEKTGDKRK